MRLDRFRRAELLIAFFEFPVIVGIAFSGWARLIDPSTVSHTSVLVYLPEPIQLMVNLAWGIAGTVIAVGILLGRKDIHVGGLVFLGATFTAYLMVTLTFKAGTLLSVLYIPAIAIGSFFGVYVLTRYRFAVERIR